MSASSRQFTAAERLSRQGAFEPAIEACYEALRNDEKNPAVHALLADALLRGDLYQAAIDHASRAIQLDAGFSPAYLALGLAYDALGMTDQSLLVWQELTEIEPELTVAQVHLGEALRDAGFAAEALDTWRAALTADPHQSRAMYDIAMTTLEREGVAAALPSLREAGELDPSQDEFFFELAGFDPKHMQSAKEKAGSDRDSMLQLALVRGFEDDYFGAAEIIRSLLDTQPDDAQVLALAGYLYLKQESVNEAMAVSLRALAVSARTPSAVYVLGSAFARRASLSGNSARVFGALARAVPEHAMSHVLLAESLLGLQDHTGAKAAYEKAVRVDAGQVRARFGLAAVMLAEGEYRASRAHMREGVFRDTVKRKLFEQLYDSRVSGGAA